MTRFQFTILGTDDPEWDEMWNGLPTRCRDVFYGRGYARLNQAHVVGASRVLAAVATEGAQTILYPFVLRRLDSLPGMDWVDADLSDARGLYGRSGPVGSVDDVALVTRFGQAVCDFFATQGVVTSFDRLHPTLNAALPHLREFETATTGPEVVVGLAKDPESLWRGYRASVRKNCRKASMAGVTCFRTNGEQHWAEFVRIYDDAMVRKKAADFYHFGHSYFRALQSELPESHSLYIAEVDGRAVSAELVLHDGEHAHSFLGGTDPDALHMQPNTLLKATIDEDLRKRGFAKFVLGGGVTPEDGVFAYKKSFAPLGVVDSKIWLGLHDADSYRALREECGRRGEPIASGRFQFYDRG